MFIFGTRKYCSALVFVHLEKTVRSAESFSSINPGDNVIDVKLLIILREDVFN